MEDKKLTPAFFFLSIGVVASLIVSVTAFLRLVFATLDKVFPDVLSGMYQYGYSSSSFEQMRVSTAMLIIVVPVFFILSRQWMRLQRAGLSHWDSVLRKWVILLILFVASVVAVVDLVVLVSYFVSGEITVRFVLKVLATLIAVGIPGWYYAQLLSTDNTRCKQIEKWAGIKSSVLVLAAIVWAFTVMGSPFAQRALRLDQRRIEDLQSIQWQIVNYWQQRERLPESFGDMADPLSGVSLARDPEFQKGKEYEYKKTGDMSFELCATFAEPLPEGWVEYGNKGGYGGEVMPMRDSAVSSAPYYGNADSWDHKAGRTCFARTIDPELYPPYPKPER
ncbi:hypothetical protein IT401_01030 [Candidatus Nomurabacteria bacterium]|nr:hypothetical protein [Candidatus Nomurabacteria bacterium]